MERKGKSTHGDPLRGIIHCPLCGRELEKGSMRDGGWQCRCGEFVPEGFSLDSFQGCTHGLNCNCGRERKR